MNKCIFMGRLCSDPETRVSQGGMTVTRFRMAVDRPRTSDEKKADFINVIAFGKQAETIDRYVRKGQRLLVATHVQTDAYTNREGRKIYTTDFAVESFNFLESANTGGNTSPEKQESYVPDGLEDLPFN